MHIYTYLFVHYIFPPKGAESARASLQKLLSNDTPSLHHKILHHKIFARVWVAQEPICS